MNNKFARKVVYGKEYEEAKLRGSNLSKLVAKSAYGVGAGNVMIERNYGAPVTSRDGVSNLEQLHVAEPVENMVIQTIVGASQRTNQHAGDGPQPLYAKVLTPTGFISMGDIVEGMEVCGTDGSIQTVLGVYDKGNKDIYRVSFTDGRVVECCIDHLWTVTTSDGAKKTITVGEMIEHGIVRNKKHSIQRNYFVQRNQVEFNEKTEEMVIDPYTLGVLLGDGSLSGTGAVELSLGFKKRHILDKLALPDGVTVNPKDYEEKNYIRVKLLGEPLKQALQKLSLYGTKSNDKFIPKTYLYSSLASRKALLQGLLDTDGYINSRGLFEFSTVSPQLAKDFSDLCHGLGYDLYADVHDRVNDPDSYSDTPIFRMIELMGRKYGMAIDSIEPTGESTPMRCILVSNSDNLYITDGYIVTHNTTATAILASDLYEQGVKDMRESGRSPIQIANQILETSREVYKFIDSKKVKANKKDLKNIARISSHDNAIGDMISFIFDNFGGDGGVVVGTHDGDDTTMSMEDGFYFKKGFTSPVLTSRPGMRESYLTDVPVLVISKVLKTSNDLIGIFEKLGQYAEHENHVPLEFLMVADVEGEALAGLEQNDRKYLIPTLVTPLDHGARKDAFFADIATYTGGKVISNNDFNWGYFGHADEIIVSAYTTNIIGGAAQEDIALSVQAITEQAEKTTDTYDLEFLEERKNRLMGKIATISVGGETEEIRIEKKLRVDDAVNAVRSAKLYGILPGEAEPLLWAAANVPHADPYGNLFLYLLENCGIEDPDSYAYKLVDECKFGEGYDISGESLPEGSDKKTVINLRAHGIVDPVQVVLETVRNAAAVAALLVTSTTGMYYENRDIKQD